MNNEYDSATPEQRFWMMRSQILTSLLNIEGYTKLTREDLVQKGLDVSEIVRRMHLIEESAKQIHNLLDEVAEKLRGESSL